MPTFESDEGFDWKKIQAKRRRITRDLIAKGLDPRSLKFSEVLHRKMRR